MNLLTWTSAVDKDIKYVYFTYDLERNEVDLIYNEVLGVKWNLFQLGRRLCPPLIDMFCMSCK